MLKRLCLSLMFVFTFAAVAVAQDAPPADEPNSGTEETNVDAETLPTETGYFGDFGWPMILAWVIVLGLPLVLTIGLFAFGGDARKDERKDEQRDHGRA